LINTTLHLIKDTWHFYKTHIVGLCGLLAPFIISINLMFFTAEYLNDKGEGADLITSLITVINFLLYPIYQGALVLYIASVLTGDCFTKTAYYRLALQYWRPLMWLYILLGFAIAGGFILFIIPGFIILSRLSFAEFYCLLEKNNNINAIKKSWANTKNNQWVLLAGIIALSFFIIFLFVVEYILISLDVWNVVFSLVIDIIADFLFPIITIFAFRVYTISHSQSINIDSTENKT
jgi:membrane-anchored glycerophosphoryl diester phosphodiesterase (GDPDase)